MSYNANESEMAMKAKLLRVERLYREMAVIMMENPHCLDANAQKGEVIQMQISHLKAKLERSKSERVERANRAMVIRLGIFVDCFEEGQTEYAQEVIKSLFELSVEELKYAPEELKERAIAICEQYFTNY